MPHVAITLADGTISLSQYQAKVEECAATTSALTSTQERLAASHAANAVLATTLQQKEAELSIIKDQLIAASEAVDHAEAVVSEDSVVVSAQRDHIQQLEQLVEVLQSNSTHMKQQLGALFEEAAQEFSVNCSRRESDPGCSDFRSKQLKFEQLGHLQTRQKLADAEYQLDALERSRDRLQKRIAEIEQQLEQFAGAASASSTDADTAALQQQLRAAEEAAQARNDEVAALSAELRACPFKLAKYEAIIKHKERKVALLQQQLSAAQGQAQQLAKQQQPRQHMHQHSSTAAASSEDPDWCLLEAAAAWLEAHRVKKKLAVTKDQLAAVQEQLLGWQCADIVQHLAPGLCSASACSQAGVLGGGAVPGVSSREGCSHAHSPALHAPRTVASSAVGTGNIKPHPLAGSTADSETCNLQGSSKLKMSAHDSSSSLLQSPGSHGIRQGGMQPSQSPYIGDIQTVIASSTYGTSPNKHEHSSKGTAASDMASAFTSLTSTVFQGLLSLRTLVSKSRHGLQQSMATTGNADPSGQSKASCSKLKSGGPTHSAMQKRKPASWIGADVTVQLKSRKKQM